MHGFERVAIRYAAADVFDDLAQPDAHGHFHQTGVGNFAGEGEDLGTLAVLRTHAREPLAALAENGRDVGEGFHVVDQRRLAPQAAHGRVRWTRFRHAATAFNRGDQGRLFATDEGAGSEPDFNVEAEGRVADVVAEQAAPPCIAQCGLQARDRQRILGTHVDVALAGANGIGRDGHALNNPLRVALEHAAVHEGAGVALVAIADDVLQLAGRLGHRAPLEAGRVTAAATSTQSAFGDLTNHAGWRHVAECGQQRLIAVARNVVVNLFRVNVAGVFKHHVHLLVKVLAQVALQLLDRFAAQVLHDLLCIFGTDMLIERFFRIHQNQRSGRAQPHAAGAAHKNIFALRLRLLFERSLQRVGVLAQAAGAHADVDLVVELVVFGSGGLRDLVQFFERHSTAHLSSCSIICACVIWPTSSPSVSTTGARPQAPTQRAVVRLMFPSLVVSP